MQITKTFIILIILSMVGGAIKIWGSHIGGSRSVFVDAMTSIANTLSVALMFKFFKAGMEPPDKDHHYGHHRLILGGAISTLMLYSFVAGIIILNLVSVWGKPYEVDYESPLCAIVALIPYGLAIHIAKRSHSVTTLYAGFTAIEIIESGISIGSSIGGVFVSYIIDFIGALILTVYLFIELTKNFRSVVSAISDIAPKDIVEKIFKIVKDHGLEADRVRIRRVMEGVYQGDIIIRIPSDTSIEYAHQISDSIEKKLKENGIDVTVHIEPSTDKPKNDS